MDADTEAFVVDIIGPLDGSEDGTGRGTPIIAFAWQAGGKKDASGAFNDDGTTPTLPKSQTLAIQEPSSTVRRLTPTECERLMGWPDGHTAHRVDFKTGRVVAQADSSRYRQCGNGMAAPVVAWIAQRIAALDGGRAMTGRWQWRDGLYAYRASAPPAPSLRDEVRDAISDMIDRDIIPIDITDAILAIVRRHVEPLTFNASQPYEQAVRDVLRLLDGPE